MKLKHSKQSAFTLLEVMVALLIIAVTLVAIGESISANTVNAQHIKNKTIATLLAKNKMVELRTSKAWPPISKTKGIESMVNTEWFWVQNVVKTEDPLLRRVNIEVSHDSKKEAVLFKLTGFIAKL